jgi:phage terminase small subunit
MPDQSLSPKQKRFVEEYILDCNATAAARRAGYSAPTAQEQGSRLLSNVMVQAAVTAKMQERSARLKVDADEALVRLARLSRASVADFVSWGPGGLVLKDSASIPDELLACVAEVSETTTRHGGTVKFKLHDKVKALELLARHLGLLKDGNTNVNNVFINWDALAGRRPQPDPVEERIAEANGHATNGHPRD